MAYTRGLLIAARVAQGLGAAVMMALSMALTMAFVGEAVPKSQTVSAMGVLGTMSAVGTALGPMRGSFGAPNVALLAAAVVGVGLFLRAETTAASPLVPLAMFRSPLLAAGFALSALVTTVVMATLVVGPFYLSGALAVDAARVGLVMSSGPVAAALTSVPAGRFVDRHGPQRASLVGLVAMAVGAAVLVTRPAAPTSVQASTAAARSGRRSPARKALPSTLRKAPSVNSNTEAPIHGLAAAARAGNTKPISTLKKSSSGPWRPAESKYRVHGALLLLRMKVRVFSGCGSRPEPGSVG